ncbi:MAG: DinB family protein [Candidatus Bathyarchaeia archaeon]
MLSREAGTHSLCRRRTCGVRGLSNTKIDTYGIVIRTQNVVACVLTIQELFEYSRRVRYSFATKLSELQWEQVEKNREASFYSMKNILIHMIDNEDWIVNWVIPGKLNKYSRRKSEEYTNMNQVLEHLGEVEERTKLFLQNIDERELNRKVNFVLSSGKTFDLSVEECLFQSFTEQLYHLGELIALLWQENVEPPKMQWFWNNPRHNP